MDDRVRGLQAGGDDYLTKPFAFAELLARVQALVRRATRTPEPTTLTVGDLTLDLLSRKVTRAGMPIELRPREFALLEYLMRNAGKVVSKTMILSHVWEYNFDPQTNIVDVLVSRLRDKIDRPFEQQAAADGARRRLCPPLTAAGPLGPLRAAARAAGTRHCSWSAAIVIVVLTYYLTASSLAQRDQQIIQSKLGRVRARSMRAAASARSAATVGRSSGRAPERLFVRVVDRGVGGDRAERAEGWDPATLETVSLRAGRRHAGAGGQEHRSARRSARAASGPRSGSSRCRSIVLALTGGWLATQSALSADSAADRAPCGASSRPAAPTSGCWRGRRRRDRRADAAVQRDAGSDRGAGAPACAARSTTCRTICARR